MKIPELEKLKDAFPNEVDNSDKFWYTSNGVFDVNWFSPGLHIVALFNRFIKDFPNYYL